VQKLIPFASFSHFDFHNRFGSAFQPSLSPSKLEPQACKK